MEIEMRNDPRRDAGEFLRQLRLGKGVSEGIQTRVAKFPTIDLVRSKLKKLDLSEIMKVAGTEPAASGGVAFALLTPFAEYDLVSEYLIMQWINATSFLRRDNILWPLLEIQSLPDQYHKEGFAFINGHLDEFVENCLPWWGTRHRLLDTVRKRMDYKKTPKTKHWIYLCVAMGSDNHDGLLHLLEEAARSPWGINASVANTLRTRLIQKKPCEMIAKRV